MSLKKKPETRRLTPMMRQYMDKKQELSDDTILLFRMGDFYELFFEDAEKGSKLMNVALTKRSGVPMCGVPYHAKDTYVPRILNAGQKVAIAEQMEDPKEAKGIVKRDIIQIITPGTILNDAVLKSGISNFIVAICELRNAFGVASLDISTGEFKVTEVASKDELYTELYRLNPAECLIPDTAFDEWEKDIFPNCPQKTLWTPLDEWIFDLDNCRDLLLRHFGVSSLDGFGCRGMKAAIAAAGAGLYYTQNNLRKNADHITSLSSYNNLDYIIFV